MGWNDLLSSHRGCSNVPSAKGGNEGSTLALRVSGTVLSQKPSRGQNELRVSLLLGVCSSQTLLMVAPPSQQQEEVSGPVVETTKQEEVSGPDSPMHPHGQVRGLKI